MDSTDQDWKVDCSDDENYGLTYNEVYQQFVPDALTVVQLFESFVNKDSPLTTLEWVCPGRRNPTNNDSDGEADTEESKAEEKSDFDFLDEPNAPGLGAKRVLGTAVKPRGSAKKKTTSLDGILSSMRRHRKIDNEPVKKMMSQKMKAKQTAES